MMKFIIAFGVFFGSVTMFANTDKAQYCPQIEQIEIVFKGEPNLYIYQAKNDEGRVFTSGIYGGNANNGPAPAIKFLGASYQEENKELSCEYYAYSIYGFPLLVNQGDY